MPRVLLVDDDEAITANLAPLLERAGLSVTVAGDAERALELMAAERPDVAVLDVLLPGTDGRALLRGLRAAGHDLPVLMLTQVGGPLERAMALDEGADDYLDKPFDPYEFIARVRALLRRAASGSGRALAATQRLRSGHVVLDRVALRVLREDREVPLTPKAVALLAYFMTHPDELLTRERLLEAVWGWRFETTTRAVDTRVAELRRLLDDDPARPLIVTVAGQGYRFEAEVTAG